MQLNIRITADNARYILWIYTPIADNAQIQ
jgi:hypothetical protein